MSKRRLTSMRIDAEVYREFKSLCVKMSVSVGEKVTLLMQEVIDEIRKKD